MDFLVGLFIGWCIVGAICGFVGAYVSNEKGRPTSEGVVFGLLLGPIGILIAAVLPTLIVQSPSKSRGSQRFATPQSRQSYQAVDEEDIAAGWIADASPAKPANPSDPIEAIPEEWISGISPTKSAKRPAPDDANVADFLGSLGAPAVDIKRQGTVAYIAAQYRSFLDDSVPDWPRLPAPKIRAALKDIEPRLMKELNFRPTEFSDLSADARRLLLSGRSAAS